MSYVLDIAGIVYRDIAGIRDYIALDKPSAALDVTAKIFTAIDSLPHSPLAGIELCKKFGIVTDLRIRIVRPYIVIYKIEGKLIKVYRVLDGRSDYLARLELITEADG